MKGGGHATSPGFSSTEGVQIAMARFNETKVNHEDETVTVGSGLTWGQVYNALNSTGVNVVGGRVPEVGVAGLTLGGGKCQLLADVQADVEFYTGYSFKTNQFGLAIDNIAAYNLVLPNGTIKTVTSQDEDLWFALRVSD